MKKIFVVLALCLFACASTYPIRDFEVQLWRPNVADQQAQRFNEETGEVITIDFKDQKLEDLIMLTPEDYIKERKYQELLIKSCAEWR